MRLLVVDDDYTFRKNLTRALARRGYEVYSAGGGDEAIRLASAKSFDLAFVDMKMPHMDGLQVVKELRCIRPELLSIILTGYGSIPNAVEAIKTGAYDYLTKPCRIVDIESVIERVSGRRSYYSSKERVYYQGIVGRSKSIERVVQLIHAFKDSTLPVLITGESGTGKELVARALHFDSIRKDKPFVAINCASLKPELLENELFGHVRGAFTGATGTKDGLLKAADGGTLFIDEVADMDPTVQASLLRFIETGFYRPLGSVKEVRVNVRIVAAINKTIEDEVRAKRFRHDLYYRLNVCRIDLPPLRDRKEDIPLLVDHFINTFVCEDRKITFSSDAIDALKSHHWPGNVRELFNLLSRVILLTRGQIITNEHIKPGLKLSTLCRLQGISSPLSLEDLERRHILALLKMYGMNISKTARALGIDRRTLQRKMKRYGIR